MNSLNLNTTFSLITLPGNTWLRLLGRQETADLLWFKFDCKQANLAIQEGRLNTAMADLNAAQAQLDEKEAELALVQAEFDKAMSEKQVWMFSWTIFYIKTNVST